MLAGRAPLLDPATISHFMVHSGSLRPVMLKSPGGVSDVLRWTGHPADTESRSCILRSFSPPHPGPTPGADAGRRLFLRARETRKSAPIRRPQRLARHSSCTFIPTLRSPAVYVFTHRAQRPLRHHCSRSVRLFRPLVGRVPVADSPCFETSVENAIPISAFAFDLASGSRRSSMEIGRRPSITSISSSISNGTSCLLDRSLAGLSELDNKKEALPCRPDMNEAEASTLHLCAPVFMPVVLGQQAMQTGTEIEGHPRSGSGLYLSISTYDSGSGRLIAVFRHGSPHAAHARTAYPQHLFPPQSCGCSPFPSRLDAGIRRS